MNSTTRRSYRTARSGQIVLALLMAFSMVIAPLAPLAAPPTAATTNHAATSATNGLADLFAHAADRLTTLYNDLFAAPSAAAQSTDTDGDGVNDDVDLDDDNDGILDSVERPTSLFYGVENNNYFDVWVGNGDGTFAPTAIRTDATIPNLGNANTNDATFFKDVNGDGFGDFIFAVEVGHGSYFDVWLGNDDGTFAATAIRTSATIPNAGNNTRDSMFMGDANLDGNLDIAYGYFDGKYFDVWLGNGDGTFATDAIRTSGVTMQDFGTDNQEATFFADVTSDGIPDFIFGRETLDYWDVWAGNGDGTFATTAIRTSSVSMQFFGNNTDQSSYIGDTNGDGHLDLVYAIRDGTLASDNFQVWTGNGDGTFATTHIGTDATVPDVGSFNTNENSFLIDTNGDTILDIVYGNETSDIFDVWLGNGDGTFATTAIRTGAAIPNFGEGPGDASFAAPLERDTDGDGTPNHRDLDSDGDGIPDNVEAQSTTGYIAPSGTVDANGVDTAYSGGLTPVNSDIDANPDYIDTNSDNGGDDDATEAGNPATNPTYADVNGSLDDPTTLPDTDGDLGSGGDVDYRDNLVPPPDTDGDGLTDDVDLDDDNDGILDGVERPVSFIYGNEDNNYFDVWFGNGDGTFALTALRTSATIPNIGHSTTLEDTMFADVNSDGFGDVVYAIEGGDYVDVWLGNGDGTFAATAIRTAVTIDNSGTNTRDAMFMGDANNDGVPDIAYGYFDSKYFDVWLGYGDGTFVDTAIRTSGVTMQDFGNDGREATLFGDVTSDGFADFIFGRENLDYWDVWAGNGDGTFATTPIRTSGVSITFFGRDTNQSSFLGDTNNDGTPDLVYAIRDGFVTNNFEVWTGNGDGTFATTPIGTDANVPDVGSFNSAEASFLVDADGDGNLDIIYGNETSDIFDVWLGNGDGTFATNAIRTSGAAIPNFGDSGRDVTFAAPLERDTDGDGTPDHLDLDSDGDGIPDNVEAQSTAGYVAPSGTVDADGVDTAYSGGLTPVNSDGMDSPDYLDTDSDNDVQGDAAESGSISAGETYADVNGSLDTGADALPDGDGTGDVDFRESNPMAPGGVDTNLTLWLRADVGVTSSGAGTDVTQWDDVSGNGHVFVQDGGNGLPLYETTNPKFNFNPSLDFINGGADRLRDNAVGDLIDPSGIDVYSFFAATVMEASSTQTIFAHRNSATNQYQFNATSGGRNGCAVNWQQGVTPPTFETLLLGITYDGTAANRHGYINGLATQDPNCSTMINEQTNGTAIVGGGPSAQYHGHTAEVIVYDQRLTFAEAQRVNSYLGIKYGITLDATDVDATVEEGDYVLSDGSTVVWDYSANSGYHNNVAGIGLDGASGLNQKQSKSVNSGSFVTIGLGSVEASNGANPNIFGTDGSFLVWGHNGQAASSVNDLVGTNYRYMNRIWTAQETDSVGTVEVQVPQFAPSYDTMVLIRSTDATFDNSDEIIPLTANGDGTYSADIDFNDGDYFTFARTFTDLEQDSDNDTIPDYVECPASVVAALNSGPSIRVWSGVGDGTYFINPVYTNPTNVNFGVNQYKRTLLGDVDGDGIEDLVAALGSSATGGPQFRTWLGNGNATFQTVPILTDPNEWNFGGSATEITRLGDVNGDGLADIVSILGTAEIAGGAIWTFLSNGDGTFAPDPLESVNLENVNFGRNSTEMSEMADVDGDGQVDVVALLGTAAAGNPSSSLVYRGQGNGFFNPVPIITVLNNVDFGVTGTEMTMLGDVNLDGMADIVAAHESYGGEIRTWLATGAGSFEPDPIVTSSVVQPNFGQTDFAVTMLRDVNGDGYGDIVSPLGGSATYGPAIHVFLGNGDGSFVTTAAISGGLVDVDYGRNGNEMTLLGNVGIDSDLDGIADCLDADSDNDGIPDAVEVGATPTSPVDSDGDGLPDFRDLDSDNDSINDVDEAGNIADADGNGLADGADYNGDGMVDDHVTTPVDNDNDSTPDYLDLDSNDDGTSDLVASGSGATDGDSDDRADGPDTDNDGIVDNADNDETVYGEGGDLDSDGVADSIDLDDDNDGIPDVDEGDGQVDTDGDGVPDSRDLDSDNDGINDVVEVNGVDEDGDGMYDACGATATPAALFVNITNTTGDMDISQLANQGQIGYQDFRIGRYENDKIVLFEEQSLTLANPLNISHLVPVNGGVAVGNSSARIPAGSQVKSFYLHYDPVAGNLTLSGSVTFDRDIYALTYGYGETHASDFFAKDFTLFYRGAWTGREADDTITISSDRRTIIFNLVAVGALDDFRILFADTNQPALADGNSNGLLDCLEASEGGTPLTLVDSDSDTTPDFRDLDSDNDSIGDVIEGGSGGVDADNNGVLDGPDGDGDGIMDSVDGNIAAFGDDDNGLDLSNQDGDADPDYRDIDSNNDGTFDIDDFGNGAFDADNDGIADGTNDSDGDGILDTPDSDDTVFGGLGVPTSIASVDTDGDGIPDFTDVDDDNDGLLDSVEGNSDTDGDGIPNRLDLDSDNDGINDAREGSLIDLDGDGTIDGPDNDGDGMADDPGNDADGDGYPSSVDPDENGGPVVIPPDSDGDGIPDYLDLDSDNDAISDLVESGSGGTDADDDGVIDQTGTNDSDGDGIMDSVDGDTGAFGDSGDPLPTDTDGDSAGRYPDYLDDDSDNDGTFDIATTVNSALDADNNGWIDTPTDADNDGIADDADLDDAVFGGLAAPVNNPPEITQPATEPAAISILENTTVITDVEATDDFSSEISGTLVYTLSGPDASLMSIDAGGNLSFDSAPDFETPGDVGADNIYSVTVTVADSSGLTDTVDIEVTVTDVADTDTTPPAAPVMVSPTDGEITNDNMPVITGTAPITEAGATITVAVGSEVLTTTVGPDGTWAVTPTTPLADGVYTPTLTIEDTAGNVTGPEAGNAFTVDTMAPSDPVMLEPAASDVITETTPIISGTGESGAEISVEVDGQTLTTTVAPNGSWSVTPTALADGVHTPTLTITDPAGNVTGPIDGNSFEIDTTAPPAPTVTEPVSGTTVLTNTPTITGTTEPSATVEITDGGGNVVCTTTADGGGNFSCTTDPLPDGEGTLSVTATDDAGNTSDPTDVTITVGEDALPVPVQAFLQGAYVAADDAMRDDLRALPDFPLTSPYGGSESTSAGVLAVSDANDAIVDWVLIELRGTGALSTTVVASQAALLQRDGDVVDASDGTSVIRFAGLSAGDYHVAIQHRNHLAVMTADAVAVSASTPLVDFTGMADAQSYGTHGQAEVEPGVHALWTGDINGDSRVKFASSSNDDDRQEIFNAVVNAPGNIFNLLTYAVAGYHDADINLDGETIFSSSSKVTDSNVLFDTVTEHPDNLFKLLTYSLAEQLP